MSEWTHTRIRDLLETSYAGDWGTSPSPGNARILRATDIDSDGRVTGNGALRQIPFATLQEKSLKKGDILLEASGGSPEKPVGRVAFFYGEECPIPSLTSNFFKTLRPAKSTSARFVHWALLRFYRQPNLLQYQQQTTGIINLKFQDYLDAILHIPCSKKEQSLIARILDTLDIQIEKTEALIAKLEKVKEGLLHDLLTRGIDENGQLRPSPEQAPELYKESPLGLIPMEWALSSGVEACKEIVVGIVIKPTQYYRASGVPILRSANVRENYLSLDNLMYMSQQDHKAMSKSAVKTGNVLTVRTGYPGTSCVVDSSIEEANCVDIIISRTGEGLDPNFWALWINSDFGKGHVLKSQGGLAQQHFNVGDLKKIKLPIPTMTEQLRVVKSWAALQKQIQQESNQLEKLQINKSGLMDDLLTGRVRVTPLLEQ